MVERAADEAIPRGMPRSIVFCKASQNSWLASSFCSKELVGDTSFFGYSVKF
jgi:hypothetical protein